MRTRTFQDVLKAVCAHRDKSFSTDYFDSRPDVAQFVNDHLRSAWHFAWWKDLLKFEKRHYRAAWAADTEYSIGSEVWKNNSEGNCTYWYSLTDANTGNDPATDGGTNWIAVEEIDDDVVADYIFEPRITLDPDEDDADGGSEIGEKVWAVCSADPRRAADGVVKYGFIQDGSHLWVRGDRIPAEPFVVFLPPVPVFATEAWADGDYTPGSIIYHDSTKECWKAPAGAAAGDAPGTAATWEKVEFPAVLFDYVTRKAYCDWYRSGQIAGQDAESKRRSVNDLEQRADDRLEEAALLHAEA
jgi:hypothetical protein